MRWKATSSTTRNRSVMRALNAVNTNRRNSGDLAISESKEARGIATARPGSSTTASAG